jgi:hypothetical protein
MFARGFRLHLRNGQVLDGVAFPSGRALVVDDPEYGLVSAATSVDELLKGYHKARIEWAGEPKQALSQQHPPGEQVPKHCRACASELFNEYWRNLPAEEQQGRRLVPVEPQAAIARVRATVDELCRDPHPGHDHVCPDDVRKAVHAALDQPKEQRT